MNPTTTTSFKMSPMIIKIPCEKMSAMVSISETALVTKVPIGVLSKYFHLKAMI